MHFGNSLLFRWKPGMNTIKTIRQHMGLRCVGVRVWDIQLVLSQKYAPVNDGWSLMIDTVVSFHLLFHALVGILKRYQETL